MTAKNKIIKTPTAKPTKVIGITIKSYLLDRNPQGVQQHFISNHMLCAVSLSQQYLNDISRLESLNEIGVYVLINNKQEIVYVGCTDDYKKLPQDISSAVKNDKYGEWQDLLLFTTQTFDTDNHNALIKAEAQYLEYLINTNQVAKDKQIAEPKIEDYQQTNAMHYFADIKLLTIFLKYPLFK